MEEERRKRKWHQVVKKGENIVALKRQANDAEMVSRRAEILSQERDAECQRALLRQVCYLHENCNLFFIICLLANS